MTTGKEISQIGVTRTEGGTLKNPPNLTTEEEFKKNLLFLFIVAYYFGGYLVANYLTSFRTRTFDLLLPFEKDLPFVPILIYAYSLIFLIFIIVYFTVSDYQYFRKIFLSFIVCVTLHFIIFTLFPVKYSYRPDLGTPDSWLLISVQFYYWLDLPYNCFPSMHVSTSTLSALSIWNYRRWLSYILLGASVIIGFSVVLVKQHYIVDVLTGYALSGGIYWWFFVRTPKRS